MSGEKENKNITLLYWYYLSFRSPPFFSLNRLHLAFTEVSDKTVDFSGVGLSFLSSPLSLLFCAIADHVF